jgi:hypothetical protein
MLTLTPKQLEAFNAMMRQSFEDRMVAYLRQHLAACVRPLSDTQLRQRIRQEITTAQHYGITRECDVALYICIALSVAPQHPAEQLDWVRSLLQTDQPPPLKVHLLRHTAQLHLAMQKEVTTR